MQKLEKVLHAVMGGFFGAFIGISIWQYWDYRSHPDIYAMNSAPWYISLIIPGIVMMIIVIVCAVILAVIRKKQKEGNS